MKKLFLLFIKFYKKCISPFLPNACRFYPTCSEYAFLAIDKYGVIKGCYLAVIRLSKCHPFHEGGVDLVPENYIFMEQLRTKYWRNSRK